MTADAVGGVWTYVLDLASGLLRNGHSVVLATMGPEPNREQVQQASAFDLRVSKYKLEWMEEPWDEVHAAGEWLLNLESEVRPDVVHLNGFVHGSLPWRAPVLCVAHSCVLSWWQDVKGEAAPTEWARYGMEVREGLQAAQMVVAPSMAMLAAADRYYGPFSSARVIHNGRSSPGFRALPKEPFIFGAGRVWDEAKNTAALQSVAPMVHWPIYVAGGGGAHSSCNYVQLGRLPQKELARWFGRAAIFAHPARYEPFGLAPLEAALCGCVLVLGDIPSLREIWGDAAIYVSPDDRPGLARVLNELVSDASARAEWGARAFERAQLYSVEAMVRGYEECYSELVGAGALRGVA